MAEKQQGTVYEVDLSKVDEPLLNKYLKQLNMTDRGDLAGKVRRLVERFKEQANAGTIRVAECSTCGGCSDESLPECPYCGDPGMDDDGEQPEIAATPDANTNLPAAVASPKTMPAASPPSELPPAKATGKPKKKRSEAGKATGKKAASKAKPADKKADKKKATTKPKAAAKAAPKPTTEIVKFTVKDLNNEVKAIAQAAIDTAVGLWNYGKHLTVIHADELWKLRANKKGEPTYKSFDQFCKEEMKLSRQHAYSIMTVCDTYTEAQLKRFGISKLRIALQVPEESRAGLLGDGSESAASMTNRAREMRDGGKAAADKSLGSAAVTVAIVPGATTVPMWKRPKRPGPVGEETTPAKTLQDDPWCHLKLTNNVTLFVRLTRSETGELLAIVEHRRGAEIV